MNFKNIIDLQIKLDKALETAHNTKEIDITKENIVALYTEVAEFANEVQSFKHWKKQKKINQENLLEEYADGLHFLLSFAYEYNVNLNIEPLVLSNDINVQFILMFKSITRMFPKMSRKKVEKSIAIYLGLAQLLKIDDKQIENAYKLKNQKNFERIKNNY